MELLDSYYIHIDTRFLDSNALSNSFNVPLKTGINCNENEYLLISINSLELPFAWYSINANNNTIAMLITNMEETETYINTSFTIEPSNYTATGLAVKLYELIIENAGGELLGEDFTVSFNKYTHHFIFTMLKEDRRIVLTIHNDMKTILGYTDTEIEFYNGGISESDILINMNGNKYIFVRCNLSSKNVYEMRNQNLSNVLVKVPILVNQFETIYFNNVYDASGLRLSEKSINGITVYLTDYANNLIDLNGINWSLTLKIKKYRTNNIVYDIERFHELYNNNKNGEKKDKEKS
jgi:hypothetical protein